MKDDIVTVGEGGVALLNVYATGNPIPDVYWRKGASRDIDTRKGKYILVDDSSLKVLTKIYRYLKDFECNEFCTCDVCTYIICL